MSQARDWGSSFLFRMLWVLKFTQRRLLVINIYEILFSPSTSMIEVRINRVHNHITTSFHKHFNLSFPQIISV
jgi:hypothetical protein